MDFLALLSLVMSVCVFGYTIFRDSGRDTNLLASKIATLETKVAVQDSSIQRISNEQGRMQATLDQLNAQIHEVDKKIMRIITILEKENK
ncbi:MAG: hypothetical protein K0S95_760 [Pantoea eucrina]|jgi:peptidoglycan hydrolase CwlO-like protein|nr:hypothetical protein [Pantoea eucrina]